MGRFGHLLGRRASGPLPPIAACFFALGNPGREYQHTRHNIGWMALDHWIGGRGVRVKWEAKGPCALAAITEGTDTILVVKPTTYMNLSGQAASWIKRHYGPQRMLVIHDEMNLPFGRYKFASAGGPGGHNGLRSLIAELGTREFDRLKIGIGSAPEGIVGSDYVLQPFLSDEAEQLPIILEESAKWMQLWLDRGIDVATQELQRQQRGRRSGEEPPEGPEASPAA